MIGQMKRSKWMRPIGLLMAVAAFSLAMPFNLLAYDPNKPRKAKPPVRPDVVSRLLTAEEMDGLSGRTVANPYNAGRAKLDPIVKGVNIRTGGFSMSATDLSFEGGYGIPINVTRSYSSNTIDDGPLGIGWNLSTDLRTVAGGELKSPRSAPRQVPRDFFRKPIAEPIDPNSPFSPVEAVVSTDSSGQPETIQRDVDGILTTPAWDKNLLNPQYEHVETSEGTIWLLISNSALTPEGTVYQYSKVGSYDPGARPWDDPAGETDLSNVLKVTSITDRHGNVTTFAYGETVSYLKANGTTDEQRLESVSMPNGRTITFTYNDSQAPTTYGRHVETAFDGTRTVSYLYAGNYLTSVTSPGGRTTSFVYTQPAPASGSVLPPSPGYYLSQVTDPRGLTRFIDYIYDYNTPGAPDFRVWKVREPNGMETLFMYDEPFAPEMTVFETQTYTGEEYARTTYLIQTTGGGLYEVLDADMFTIKRAYTRSKYYDPDSMDLVQEVTSWAPERSATMNPIDDYLPGTLNSFTVTKNYTYNFFGAPLKEETIALTYDGVGTIVDTDNALTEYAYWGEKKYFQQKAVRVQTGASTYRFSFTDYFDDESSIGSRGQTYRVYGDEYASFVNGTTPTWKYDVLPASGSIRSGEFAYDSQGRVTDAWKLKEVVAGVPTYVLAQSVYGSDGSPEYGNAVVVTEDVGGVGRTTQTLVFHVSGEAIEMVDAMGRHFVTTRDSDNNVLSITRTDTVPATPIATYTYGTMQGTVENGQPVLVVDELSGVSQSVIYVQSGVAVGKPEVVSESRPGLANPITNTYMYSSGGDREYVEYSTPNGLTRYHYKGYACYGLGHGISRLFSKMNRMEWDGFAWQDSSEEFHYVYTGTGQLARGGFALTPQSGQADYDTLPADTMAVDTAYYDPSGRIRDRMNEWWTFDPVTGTYPTALRVPILRTTVAYSDWLGLKTETGFWSNLGGGWNLDRTEYYTYSLDTDYLIGTDYNDGLANEVTTWSYDAAANRASESSNPGTWTYDGLNRMTSSPGIAYTHDLAGNRTSQVHSGGTDGYYWDELNRMTLYSPARGLTLYWPSGVFYQYRTDGMRTFKSVDLAEEQNFGVTDTKYYYDWQMGIEDEVRSYTDSTRTVQTGWTIQKYSIGCRGIEMLAKSVDGGSETKAYPLYDTHGSMLATLAHSGSSYSVGNVQSYDVWGSVRSGSSTEDQGYVANLGHRKDGESGLTYMRARFYEPTSGRFVSEDIARSGSNWYIYGGNAPNIFSDFDGKLFYDWLGFLAFIVGVILFLLIAPPVAIITGVAALIVAIVAAVLVVLGVYLMIEWAKKYIAPIIERYIKKYEDELTMGSFGDDLVMFLKGTGGFILPMAGWMLEIWLELYRLTQ